MEIRVDSYVENRDGVRRLVNTAYLTEVALDDEDRPTTVPGLICDSEEEKQEYQAAFAEEKSACSCKISQRARISIIKILHLQTFT